MHPRGGGGGSGGGNGSGGVVGVSGVRGGALGLGHGRLLIAHNETALSAGSGAGGKHGEGARPGQEEAGGRGGGGECSRAPFPPVSLSDSRPGRVLGGFSGLHSRGWARPRTYVGCILRRPPLPGCEVQGTPEPVGTELSGSSPRLHFVSDPAGAGEEGIWVEALGPSPLSGRGDPGTLSRRQVTSCFLVPAVASWPGLRRRLLFLRLRPKGWKTRQIGGGAVPWGSKRENCCS